jgi:hypothetical protein
MTLVHVVYSRTARYLFVTILEAQRPKIMTSVLGEGLLVLSLGDRMQKSQFTKTI